MGWHPEWMDSPEFQAEWRCVQRRAHIAELLTGWMRHLPLGSVVRTFWYCVLDEGISSTCDPRGGAMVFAYLNDGVRPSRWHTWHLMTHGPEDPYVGIYPAGAPRSRAEAEAIGATQDTLDDWRKEELHRG